MGVPKFYRWISERYPCLSEVVKEYQVPEFDNLYLDMNGIIHVCSHPNDDDPHFRITEEKIFKDIFHYIEVLFRIVRPKKVFFMAVDGVAPRAKMNQQRGRRFRSAKEAEENIKKALKKGEMLPEEKRFDSNCITPGTKFMVRLQEQLEYMVKSKVTSDPAWQGIRIYLSGHETPGEGEHKITEFIRHERMRPDYDANTRHCLYGLDADLMVLGLCSHEPHFSLLREEVRFTGKKKQSARTPKPEETTFHLLHLSLMREYIDHEFEVLKTILPFKYDLEAVIDDWVLMGFLVGNDFIPNLPHLHIAHNALPMLYETYIRVLPTLDGYLNENGIVNLARFEKYLQVLAEFDLNKFEEVYADFKWLESKMGKRKSKNASSNQNSSKIKSHSEMESFSSMGDESSTASNSSISAEEKSIQVVKELSIKQGLSSVDSEVESVGSQEDKSTYELEFQLFKRNYYQEKLHFKGTEAEVSKIAYEYILAIQWICHYYYNGVQSWSWYYPYHYAPFLSDLRNLSKMKLNYDMASPFLPYEQLLAVLPAASKDCLPEPFWDLMSSETSPIIDYYPLDFTCDLNGKQQEWEAVVLIPFINENRLLTAMTPSLKRLNKADKERNRHSGCHLYTYNTNLDFHVKSSLSGTFPDIPHCKAKLEVIPLHVWSTTNVSAFVKGVLPGCRLSVFYPGFPTLYHLPHKASLKKQGVKVFQMPSRNENMILTISPPENLSKEETTQPYKRGDTIDDIAKKLLGTSVYVNWPHMEEAKIVALADDKVKFEVTEHIHATGTKGSKHKMQRKILPKEDKTFWQDVDSIAESYLNRKGVDIGDTDFLVYAQPLLGRKYVCGQQGQITLEKQWATKPKAYALQATVKDISVKDPTFQQFRGMEELYPTGAIVFMLGQPYYGCQGKVLQVTQGMASIEFTTPREPDIESVVKQRQRLSSAYYSGWELGSRLGISNYLVSRITGTIFVFYPANQKWQVGLNLRFTRENCGIAGYTKLINGEWKYSEAVETSLIEYMEKFPEVLTYLQTALKKNENEFDASKMVAKEKESEIKDRLKELSTWLKGRDSYHGDKINEFSDILEPRVVSAVLEKVKECKGKKPLKPVEITLRPHVLHRPLAHQGTLIPDKAAQNRLLDRIVNVRDGYTVPLGMRGTIIGIHKQPGQDVLFDVVFDEEFLGGLELGGRCPKRRGYRMPECALINLSHGVRISLKDQKPMAVVRPHNKQFTRQPWQSQQQVQFQPRVHSPGGRDRNLRHPRPRYDGPREFHPRPQFVPRSSQRQPSIMQRPNSSSVQTPRSKPLAESQASNSHKIDTLWNTLKEQNKKPNPVPSSGTVATSSKTSAKAGPQRKSIPTITAPKTETKAKGVDDQSRKSPVGFTSLSQAAKSLPKVKPSMQEEKCSTPTSDSAETPAATAEINQESTRTQQTSTNPTTTVTQSKPNSGKSGADHLDSLFRSIKDPSSHPHPPRLAFTPTQSSVYNRYPVPFPNRPGPVNFQPEPPPFFNPNPRYSHQNAQPPLFFNQTPYGVNRMRMQLGMPRYPEMLGNRPMTLGPTMFPPPPSTNMQLNDNSRQLFVPLQVSRKAVRTEGTQKLCEMLNSENEDASSSKWSTGEEDEESAKGKVEEKTPKKEDSEDEKNTTEKFNELSIKDEASDVDSVKEEDYMERSTSVEDENPSPILKKKNKVEDLVSVCTKCGMLPPIYTYFTTGDEQVVSTVQLWNGVRFSSHPQMTRDKAMEEAAGHALSYLNGELRENRPVSTSPPSTLPYYVPVQNFIQPQYYPHQAAYGQPMPYASTSGHPYLVPSVPYTVLPPAPVVTIAPDYQQAAIMHPHYRFGPQYSPYVHQYPSTYVQLQVSPSRQSKGAAYHGSAAKPVVWTTAYSKDSYVIQDKANIQQTEFKLLDQPPSTLSAKKTEQKRNLHATEDSDPKQSIEDSGSKKVTNSGSVQRKQAAPKPKLAISFNKDKQTD